MATIAYEIKATANPLEADDLYEGRIVCFIGVTSNPNLIGILEKGLNSTITEVLWKATLDNIQYEFDKNGYVLPNKNNLRLYGIDTDGDFDLNVSTNTSITRGAGSSTVVSTINNLTPKDQFAICALEALIGTIQNAISMDDGTILALAIKSYKISQAMLRVATLARRADEQHQSSTDPVPVDKNNLSSDTDKLLYNINESIKANTKANKEDGIKINNIDKVKFDGTPTVNVGTMPNVTIDGTPTVNVNSSSSNPVKVKVIE